MSKSSGGTRSGGANNPKGTAQEKTYTEAQYKSALDRANIYTSGMSESSVKYTAKEQYELAASVTKVIKGVDSDLKVSSLWVEDNSLTTGTLTVKGNNDIRISKPTERSKGAYSVEVTGDIRGTVRFSTYSLKDIKAQVQYESSIQLGRSRVAPNERFDDMHLTFGRYSTPKEYREEQRKILGAWDKIVKR